MKTDKHITHVLPIDDLKPHNEEGTECDCVPIIEEYEHGVVVIHNAYDGRELGEEESQKRIKQGAYHPALPEPKFISGFNYFGLSNL